MSDQIPTPLPNPLPTTPPERPTSPGSSPVTWVVSLLLASMVGALLFAGGYLAAGGGSRDGSCAAPSEAFAALCEAYDKLKEQFVDKLDDTQLAEGAIRGLFEYGVKDPFSGYMSPDEYQRALGSLSGEFTGIGAEMAVKNLENPDDLASCTELSDTCALVVVAPLADSPAEAAGLQSGDQILAVDGETVNGSTLQDEVGKVRGESGTEVTLSVKRGERTFDLAITRAKIVQREVTSKMLDGKIGYIALHGFSQASADQFHTELGTLLDDGAVSIVFDLRDNPGGYIDAAQKIASEFIGSGLDLQPGVLWRRQEELGIDWQRPGNRHEPAARGARERWQRVGLRDRGGGAQGERPRRHHRRADLRQEHRPGVDRAGRSRRGAHHDLALVHAGPQLGRARWRAARHHRCATRWDTCRRGPGARPCRHRADLPGRHPDRPAARRLAGALRGNRTAASIRPNERRWCAVSSSCHATTEAVR